MGFIENLRQRLAAEAQVRQQREESLRLAKQAQELAHEQREAREVEILAQCRLQAEAALQESGVAILLGNLEETIKFDPSKVRPAKLHLWPIAIPEAPPDVGEGPLGDAYAIRLSREEKGLLVAIRPYNQGPDSGSVCEAVSWWDREEKVVRDYSSKEAIRSGQGINRVVHQFYKYIGVEATPDGDIIFHSKTRRSVPRSAWKDNRNILENTLGEAYGKPGVFIIEEQQWTHGPITGMS